MDANSNRIEDLLDPETLKVYRVTEYPFNLSIVHTALKAKLKEDPDYEVWVPLVYCRYLPLVRSQRGPAVFMPAGVYISNKGKVWGKFWNDSVVLKNHQLPSGYWHATMSYAKSRAHFTIHRAIACSFLSLDEYLLANEGVEDAHPNYLQVNHLNADKTDFALSNLEWCTQLGNMQHASSLGLHNPAIGEKNSKTKAIKGKVLKGEYAGHEFLMYGVKECTMLGFTQSNVSACCNGRLKSHKGCTWSFATEQEILTLPRGLDDEILGALS